MIDQEILLKEVSLKDGLEILNNIPKYFESDKDVRLDGLMKMRV